MSSDVKGELAVGHLFKCNVFLRGDDNKFYMCVYICNIKGEEKDTHTEREI